MITIEEILIIIAENRDKWEADGLDPEAVTLSSLSDGQIPKEWK